eukprot:evm.model.NODE_18044_length_13276_cov_24.207518.4
MRLFIGPEDIPPENLRVLIESSTKYFRVHEVAPDIVKEAFQDEEFRENVCLGAVNSINWARVLAQITYFFHAYFRVLAKNEKAIQKEQQQQQQQQQAQAHAAQQAQRDGGGGEGEGGERRGVPAVADAKAPPES